MPTQFCSSAPTRASKRRCSIPASCKRWRQTQGHLPIGLVGTQADLTYPYEHLGAGPETLAKLAGGSHPFFEKIKDAERPLVIVGQAALARPDGAAVLSLAAKAAIAMGAVKPDIGWNGFSVLHTAAARVAGLDLGLVPGKGGRDVDAILDGAEKGEIDVVYLLGADEIDTDRLGKAFVIYQGSHGDRGAHRADVILPGAAYTEKDAHLRQHRRPPADDRPRRVPARRSARGLEDRPGPVRQCSARRCRSTASLSSAPRCSPPARISRCSSRSFPPTARAIETLAAQGGKTGKERFGEAITDFYLTNPIARASAIMASLSAMHTANSAGATGTDG